MMNTSIERLAQRGNSQPETEFTRLMHHYSVDTLRDSYASLASQSAVGVDGVSQAADGEHLEDNRRELHRNLRERSSRPQPLRRVEIPKPDGPLRPLGIRGVADKIVPELTRRIFEAIDEPAFLDTAYGFRPAQSGHDALRQLNQAVMSQPVNWSVDLDRAQFFDTMPHGEIGAVMGQRIQDKQFLSRIARRLKAGVEPPGGWVPAALGSPQGSIVSPVMAHIDLDEVLDQGIATVVKPHCRGDCMQIR